MGYKEIYARYRQQIQDGVLKPGARVPSIRSLASELQVARKTVETAYEILIGEGYFVSLGAKGTYINPELRLTSTVSADNAVSSCSLNTQVTERKGDLRLGIPALDEFPIKNGY